MKNDLTLSICIIAYNEEKFLPSLLEDILGQTFPKSMTEVVLVDGNSTDNTKAIMEKFADENNDYIAVKVCDNPKRIQAAGWNVAITNASGDVISRIDAHTKVPNNFFEKVMIDINKGENVVGGPRPCISEGDTWWAKTMLAAENSIFGSSATRQLSLKEKCYVRATYHPSYRKEVIQTVGMFNENLVRTEDNEFNHRMQNLGYKTLYDPEIVSYQYARGSLKLMIKQKYSSGYWIGKTFKTYPQYITKMNLIPCVFVMAILITSLLALFGVYQFALAMWMLYIGFAIVFMCISMFEEQRNILFVILPCVFLLCHVSYGIGTIVGLLSKRV